MPKIYKQVRSSKIQVGLVVIKICLQAGKFQFSTIKKILLLVGNLWKRLWFYSKILERHTHKSKKNRFNVVVYT